MASTAKQIISTGKPSGGEKIVDFSPAAVKAPFFLKCAALLIDYMFVIFLPIAWLILGRLVLETGSQATIGGGIWLIGLILALINFVGLPLVRGQTVGKMLMGLTILNMDGTDIRLGTVVLRHIAGYPATALTLGIGFLISAVNASGRSLHDFIAGTIVVRGRKTQVLD